MAINQRQFKTKWGFVLACVGSAVGMANVWGFPYRMAANGGGAFLIAYIICIILLSYVGLSAEYAIGRRAGTGTLGAYQYAWKTRNQEGLGKVVGFIPLMGSMGIAIGYAVIIALILRGFTHSLTGKLFNYEAITVMEEGVSAIKSGSAQWFGEVMNVPYSLIVFHVAAVVISLLSLITGADSIEKTNKVMMPIFFILFVVLAIRVAFMPGSAAGYKFMFVPQWHYLLKPTTWVWALGQAFFSLSITGSGMIVCGAYLSKKEDVVSGAVSTAIFDTAAAVIAALVIIPAAFAFNSEQITAAIQSKGNVAAAIGAGPGLLFVTLPEILKTIPMGRLFAIFLFLAMTFAGISSIQNMFEVVAESLMYRFPKLKRNLTLIILGVICLGIGLNMEAISKWGPWMDAISIYVIPFGAIIGAISWFWVLKKDEMLEEINLGAKRIQGNTWIAIGKYVYVPFALVVAVAGIFFGGF